MERLFQNILPKSYYFASAYRRMIRDLECFRQLLPEQAAAYLRHVASDDWIVHFEIVAADSVCRLAHRESVSNQARANGATARNERNRQTGKFQRTPTDVAKPPAERLTKARL
jgi:hypothetical protein